MPPPLKTTCTLGTRASPLALAQANFVKSALVKADHLSVDAITILPMTTSGDKLVDRALREAGGKGLFTKELDDALFDGRIDFAVHSAKDMPTKLPPGLKIAGFLPREDARDALISRHDGGFDGLPQGAVVGTASLRRGALLLAARPDLTITLLRGNVGTRLAKLSAGQVDATLLALAGLRRLGLEQEASAILDPAIFIPAVGQGAIACVIREGDQRVAALLAPILCQETALALACERAFLTVLDGSCRTPIAGHAVLRQECDKLQLTFRGGVYSNDGQQGKTIVQDMVFTTKEPLELMHEAMDFGTRCGEHLQLQVATSRATTFG